MRQVIYETISSATVKSDQIILANTTNLLQTVNYFVDDFEENLLS
jgi:hypothetical protein